VRGSFPPFTEVLLAISDFCVQPSNLALPFFSDLPYFATMLTETTFGLVTLGEMFNLQKVKLPKSQLAKKSTCQKVNLPKSQLAKKSTCQKVHLPKKSTR